MKVQEFAQSYVFNRWKHLVRHSIALDFIYKHIYALKWNTFFQKKILSFFAFSHFSPKILKKTFFKNWFQKNYIFFLENSFEFPPAKSFCILIVRKISTTKKRLRIDSDTFLLTLFSKEPFGILVPLCSSDEKSVGFVKFSFKIIHFKTPYHMQAGKSEWN